MDNEVFKSVVKTLESDLVQITTPDGEAIAEIVNAAKGDRTLKEYADATGISAPTLSRIMNGKITRSLSIPTIVSLISQSEINTLGTMHKLAQANGYMSKSQQSALLGKMQLRQTREGLYASVKRMMLTIVVTELFQRGTVSDSRLLESEPGDLFTVTEQLMKYDFSFDVDHEGEKSVWCFICFPQQVDDYKTTPTTAGKLARSMVNGLSPLFLTDAWLPSQHADKKISFCFADAEVFEEFCSLMEYSKFNNCFSAILVDEENNRIVEERCFAVNSGKQQDSVFDLPLQIAINFDDSTVVDEVGENSFIIMTETDTGGADD